MGLAMVSTPSEPSQTDKEEARSVVVGTVTDGYGAVVPKTKVSFIQQGIATVVATSDAGEYEARLSPGAYSISTEKWGFCPLRRSELELRPSMKVRIDLSMVSCGIADHVDVSVKGPIKREWASHSPPHEYDSFPVRRAKGTALNLVIRYVSRVKVGSRVEYSGSQPPSSTEPVRVVVTYDVMTITADQVIFDKRRVELCARGNLVVQDGARINRPPSVTLRFQDGRPTLKEGGSAGGPGNGRGEH